MVWILEWWGWGDPICKLTGAKNIIDLFLYPFGMKNHRFQFCITGWLWSGCKLLQAFIKCCTMAMQHKRKTYIMELLADWLLVWGNVNPMWLAFTVINFHNMSPTHSANWPVGFNNIRENNYLLVREMWVFCCHHGLFLVVGLGWGVFYSTCLMSNSSFLSGIWDVWHWECLLHRCCNIGLLCVNCVISLRQW